MKEPIKISPFIIKEWLPFVNKKIQLKKPVRVFISYASEDEAYKNKLVTHLAPLVNNNLIKSWDDELIVPGTVWDKKIQDEIKRANIILLLISSNALASDYIMQTEIKNALKRWKKGKAQVIPIIVRPCIWKKQAFAQLQALPTGVKPISQWEDKDAAYVNIVEGITSAIENPPPPIIPKWLMTIGILLIAFIIFWIIPPPSDTTGSKLSLQKDTITINIDDCAKCEIYEGGDKVKCSNDTVNVTFGCPTMLFGFRMSSNDVKSEKWHRDYFRKSARGKKASFKIIYQSCGEKFGLIKDVIPE